MPHLAKSAQFDSQDKHGANPREWKAYLCKHCGGAVLAAATKGTNPAVVQWIYPKATGVSEGIPEPANSFLKQAIDSLHAPAGAVMLCASAVDAMLKAHGVQKGSLYERIDEAAQDHLITEEMAAWAHDVRLDANEPRHSDEKAPLPAPEDAARCVQFVTTLAEIMFVLPSRVRRGRGKTTQSESASSDGDAST